MLEELSINLLANYGVLGTWLAWQLYREKTFMSEQKTLTKENSVILSKLDDTINKLANSIL